MKDFFSKFKVPNNMKRPDDSSRFAFVTFLMMNDSYLASALLLAYGLKIQNSQADTVCMVTDEIDEDTIRPLKIIYDHVIRVKRIFVPHKERKGREDRPLWFTRLNSLLLGHDGNYGLNYEKVCILDADVYPIRHYDALFNIKTPAGMLNEMKSNCLEWDENGNYIHPDSIEKEGKWNWHKIYEPTAQHGSPIPKEITDRPLYDQSNLGLNGSIYVFDTNAEELESIMRDVEKPEIKKLVGNLFKWPDMQYFTTRWSGKWHSIDIRFSSFNGYPAFKYLCGCHYSGFKPWYFKQKGLKNYMAHEDFIFWYKNFLSMLENYPEMQKIKRLENIRKNILNLKVVS
ncbi:MAG: hypothetical protein KKD38_06125 [Candidatus Delongbacteria bacterium]|nr:hypothetical protein [Candidatus Delongbacteria bacterium]MCG2761205.1 hypothetical protein [Candidatus Delongbacteria bacterium]